MKYFILLALVLFMASPSFTQAIPPAGIRVWLFNQGGIVPIDPSIIKRTFVFFHEPFDLGGSYCSTDPNNPNYDVTDTDAGRCSGNDIFRVRWSNPYFFSDVNSLISDVHFRYPGQEVALTVAVWLDSNASLPNVSGDRDVNLWMQYPQSSTDNSRFINSFVNVANVLAAGAAANGVSAATDPILPHNPGQSLFASNITADALERPDMIMSWVISNLPEPITPGSSEYFNANAKLYYINNPGAAQPYDLLSGGTSTSLEIRPKDQYVAVEEGNAFVGDLSSADKLVFTNPGGQTIVSNSSINNRCDWVTDAQVRSKCDGNLSWLGTHTFNDDSQANSDTARVALRKSLSKTVQEVATIHKDNATVPVTVKNFLEASPSITDKIKYPRGQVLLVVNSSPNSASVFMNFGTDIKVEGKKVIIFSGFEHISWGDNIVYAGSGSKLASIVLSGNQLLNKQQAGQPATYQGAFVALDLSTPYATTSRVVLQGSGGTAMVEGLLVADEIIINRTVEAGTEEIAKIKYDAAFQNGALIGLSPFIRPLVTTGTTR